MKTTAELVDSQAKRSAKRTAMRQRRRIVQLKKLTEELRRLQQLIDLQINGDGASSS